MPGPKKVGRGCLRNFCVKNAQKSTQRCASKTCKTVKTVESVESVETVETVESVENVETV